MAHDLLSPSSSVQWLNCPGSIALVDASGIVDQPSPYAAEGTAAHVEAERAVTAVFSGERYVPSSSDDDMVSHASAWGRMLYKRLGRKNLAFWSAERALDLSPVTGRKGAKGTADFLAITDDGLLVIADFKYGMGVRVAAEKNPQLSIYALAAMTEFSVLTDIRAVQLIIFQPRLCETESVFTWDMAELKKFLSYVQERAALATSLVGSADAYEHLCPGESQCRFCKAKVTCPALRKKTTELIAADFDVIEPAEERKLRLPETSEEVAKCLPWLDCIEQWCDAVRTMAHGMLEQGKQVPGYKLVEGRRGPRKWLPEAEEVIRTMRIARANLYTKTLISPAKAEKAAKNGLIGPRQWRDMQRLMTQSDGKPTLVPDSDPRPPLGRATPDDFQIIDDSKGN